LNLSLKGYGESLSIPSKLVTRVTRLPYQADPFSIDHQVNDFKKRIGVELIQKESGNWGNRVIEFGGIG